MDCEYQCYLCHEIFLTTNFYKEQFNTVHPSNTRFACDIKNNCCRIFSVFHKHIKHIQRDHKLQNNTQLFVTETEMKDPTSIGTVTNIYPIETAKKKQTW